MGTGALSASTHVEADHLALVMTTEPASQQQESAFAMVTGMDHVTVVGAQQTGKELIVH